MALNNVPLSGQTLAQTRNPILQNFQAIDAAFSVDHVDYNDANQGKHNHVTMPIQSPPPAAPVTVAGEVMLYAANNGSGIPSLFFKGQNSNAATAGIDFTTSVNAATGYMRLPNGILMKWGQSGNISGSSTFTIPVVAGIPVFASAPFLVLFTLVSSNAPAAVPYWLPGTTTTTVIGFTMSNSFSGLSTTGNVAWLAFGV